MNQSAFKAEIEKGLWFITPQLADTFFDRVSKDLDRAAPITGLYTKEIEAGFVRDVLDPNGNIVDIRQDEIPEGSIGVVRCIGPMYKYGGWFNWGTDELVAMMQDFDNNPNIIGQIWRDDSGGGTVSAISGYLNFLATKQKPVVALIDTCGSANYYKNCGADYIMAENNISAMIGSIGVMLGPLYNYDKMLKAEGITKHIINADQSSDKNEAFRLALEGKYDLIKQELLNPLAIKFQNDVKAARPNLKEVPGMLTGKMFYAEEALENNAIDGIGNMEAAIDRVKFLAGARTFISTNY